MGPNKLQSSTFLLQERLDLLSTSSDLASSVQGDIILHSHKNQFIKQEFSRQLVAYTLRSQYGMIIEIHAQSPPGHK